MKKEKIQSKNIVINIRKNKIQKKKKKYIYNINREDVKKDQRSSSEDGFEKY